MNLFIPCRDAFKTADILDPRRKHKQILEVQQMLSAINGHSKAYRNHPCTLMYEPYTDWMRWYANVLACVIIDEPKRPPFIGYEPLHNAHKARLYQKDPVHYACFEQYKYFTYCNWYVVDGVIRKYKDGKLISIAQFRAQN